VVVEITEAGIVVVAVETVVVEITEAEDSSVVTIVAEITEAGIAEVATIEEVIEEETTTARRDENIEGAMIADPHDAIPENLVDGGPKARAGLADAEISRKAFI
ncbi:MAG: hypothetical protein QF612_00825, partial [Candidatus Thalassarchaeaceae archaeon]|nr:hypothetical protein [Candidatus Thalassarchaeaceae archaeon]